MCLADTFRVLLFHMQFELKSLFWSRTELPQQANDRNKSLTQVTEGKLQVEIKKGPFFLQSNTMIIKGMQDEKQKAAKTLQQYWNYRDERTIQNYIIYKCHEILMMAEMLSKIIVNHLGVESNIRMARKVLFW